MPDVTVWIAVPSPQSIVIFPVPDTLKDIVLFPSPYPDVPTFHTVVKDGGGGMVQVHADHKTRGFSAVPMDCHHTGILLSVPFPFTAQIICKFPFNKEYASALLHSVASGHESLSLSLSREFGIPSLSISPIPSLESRIPSLSSSISDESGIPSLSKSVIDPGVL